MESTMDEGTAGSTNVRVTKSVKEEDVLLCFVCDMEITGPGRFYSLATCRAQKSKSRIIEKLGQLVGDQYMVVIAEDDIICRGCATVVNTLDRLECEMGSLRGVILRFLEKKYALPEGELVNQKTNGMGQAPQIVPSTKKGSRNNPVNSMARKRQAALQHLGISDGSDIQQENINHLNNSKGAPDKWIQCNKCKYTTKYSSFSFHHLRGHSHDGQESDCDFCVPETESPPASTKKPTVGAKKAGRPANAANRIIVSQSTPMATDDTSQDSDGSETVEMIAAEISDYTANLTSSNKDSKVSTVSKGQETIKVQIVSQGQGQRKRFNPKSATSENEKEVTIEMPEIHEEVLGSGSGQMEDDGNQICVMESVEDQMMKMNDDEEDNTVYVQMVEVENKEDEDESASSKQVLTVAEDGTVEMVEVTWDEMHATDSAAQGNAQF